MSQDVTAARAILASLRPSVVLELRRILTGEPTPPPERAVRSTGGPPSRLRDRAWLADEYTRLSAEAIAINLGCNVKTVLTWLHKHKIETRPRVGQPVDAPALARRDLQSKDRRERFVIAVREWSASHDGRVPTQAEWDSTRPPGVQTHKAGRDLFGSWSAALEAAGLSPRKPGYQDERTRATQRGEVRAEMIQALKAWAAEHEGESPTLTEWDFERPLSAPSDRVARKVFGSWNAALKAAGLPVRPSGQHKRHGHAMSAGTKPGRNRQMVTGKGLDDRLPGTVKHFEGVSGR